jgi:hypothetical protein
MKAYSMVIGAVKSLQNELPTESRMVEFVQSIIFLIRRTKAGVFVLVLDNLVRSDTGYDRQRTHNSGHGRQGGVHEHSGDLHFRKMEGVP